MDTPSTKYQVQVAGAANSSNEGLAQLKKNLAEKFKLPAERIERMLSRLPATVKVEAERERADRWIKILEGLGAIATVSEVAASAAKAVQSAAEAVGNPAEAEPSKSGVAIPEDHISPAAADLSAAIQTEPKNAPQSADPGELAFVEPSAEATEAQNISRDQQSQLSNLMQLFGEPAPTALIPSTAPSTAAETHSDSSPPAASDLPVESQPAGGQSEAVPADGLMGKMESFIPSAGYAPTAAKLPSKRFTAICAGASALFLLALAGFMATGPAPEPVSLSSADIKKLLDEQKGILAGKKAASQTKPISELLKTAVEFSGRFENGPLSGSASAKINEDRIVTFSLDAVGKPGEKLTPEMLVAGARRAPWITKIEAPSIRIDLSKSEQPYSISGIAKCYIEDDTGGARYAADLRAIGGMNESGDKLTLKVLLSNIVPPPADIAEAKIDHLKGDRFSFAVPLELTLSRAEAAAPAAEEKPANTGTEANPPDSAKNLSHGDEPAPQTPATN